MMKRDKVGISTPELGRSLKTQKRSQGMSALLEGKRIAFGFPENTKCCEHLCKEMILKMSF